MDTKYKKLGLRIGLEIHQQLNTRKLFCRCPSLIKKGEKPDLIIKRNLFAVSGELGKIDVAALYEQKKSTDYYYYYWKDCCCLVELDEMPPMPINREALKIALQIALLLNAKILPLTQVMRKIVIDGSDVSGFQRTMLIAKDGFIDYEFNGKKKIKIKTICLEEESAKKIKQDGNAVYYSLDRYGIPLVEITTEASIMHPEEAKIIALKIGKMIRALNVRRGLGTVRQDLNVSIKRGVRTEIKGVQEPKLIPLIVENEIEEQIKSIKFGKKLSESVKKANEDGTLTFLRPLPGKERMYPETDIPLIKISKELIKEIKKSMPKTREQIIKELEELNNKDFIEVLSTDRKKYDIYTYIIKKLKIKDMEDKKILASILVNYLKEISREKNIKEEKLLLILKHELKTIFSSYLNGEINKAAIKESIKEIADGKKYDEIKHKFKLYGREELRKKIEEFLKKSKIEEKYLIKEVIKRFRLNAKIEDILKIVRELRKKDG